MHQRRQQQYDEQRSSVNAISSPFSTWFQQAESGHYQAPKEFLASQQVLPTAKSQTRESQTLGKVKSQAGPVQNMNSQYLLTLRQKHREQMEKKQTTLRVDVPAVSNSMNSTKNGFAQLRAISPGEKSSQGQSFAALVQGVGTSLCGSTISIMDEQKSLTKISKSLPRVVQQPPAAQKYKKMTTQAATLDNSVTSHLRDRLGTLEHATNESDQNSGQHSDQQQQAYLTHSMGFGSQEATRSYKDSAVTHKQKSVKNFGGQLDWTDEQRESSGLQQNSSAVQSSILRPEQLSQSVDAQSFQMINGVFRPKTTDKVHGERAHNRLSSSIFNPNVSSRQEAVAINNQYGPLDRTHRWSVPQKVDAWTGIQANAVQMANPFSSQNEPNFPQVQSGELIPPPINSARYNLRSRDALISIDAPGVFVKTDSSNNTSGFAKSRVKLSNAHSLKPNTAAGSDRFRHSLQNLTRNEDSDKRQAQSQRESLTMVNVKPPFRKEQASRGHQHIRLMMSKNQAGKRLLSPHSNTFEDKELIKPKSHVKVPEFLKNHLDKRRIGNGEQQLSVGQPTRDSRDQENTNQKNPLITQDSLMRGSVPQQPRDFQITDLLDYEKSQQKYKDYMTLTPGHSVEQVLETHEDIIHQSAQIQLFSNQNCIIKEIDTKMEESSGVVIQASRDSVWPSINSPQLGQDLQSQLDGQAGSIVTREIEALLDNSTAWHKGGIGSQAVSVDHHTESIGTKKATQVVFDSIQSNDVRYMDNEQVDFSPRLADGVPPQQQLSKELPDLNKPHVEHTTKAFKFQDQGGDTVRGRIRTEKLKEDRRYEEAKKQIKGQYQFDGVGKIHIDDVNQKNFLKKVLPLNESHIQRLEKGPTIPVPELSCIVKKPVIQQKRKPLLTECHLDKYMPTVTSVLSEQACQERPLSNLNSTRPFANSEQERKEKDAIGTLLPCFKVDKQPCVTEEIYIDVFKQHVEDKEIGLYTVRIDGYLDNVKEVDSGLNKYTTLKLEEAYVEALEANSCSDHQTTDEENEESIREQEREKLSPKRNSSKKSQDKDETHENSVVIKQKALAPYMITHELPDFILTQTRHKVRPKVTGTRGKGTSNHYRLPRFQGTSRDLVKSAKQDAFVGLQDFWKRKINFRLFEQATLTQVSIEIELYDDAMYKLIQSVDLYKNKPIAKVLPLYLFDDYKDESLRIQQVIEDRRSRRKPELRVQVLVQDSFGDSVIVKGNCEDYLTGREKFIVNINGQRYLSGRLRMGFDVYETPETAEQRRKTAYQLQQECFTRINYERAFFDECMRQYPDFKQPPSTMLNIVKKIGMSGAELDKEDPKKLKQLTMQIEAMFCFSMVKLEIMRRLEDEDPEFTCMVRKFKKTRFQSTQTPYYALASYERNKGPIERFMGRLQIIEILNDYSMIGRECFIETGRVVQRLKLDLLDLMPVFEIPLSRRSLSYLMGLGAFKTMSRLDLTRLTSTFPLRADLFIAIQNALAERFKLTLGGNWVTCVEEKVQDTLKNHFKLDMRNAYKIKSPTQLNPFIVRYFRQVHSQMVSHLCDKEFVEMKKMLEFLVKFVAQNEGFRNHPSYQAYHLDKILVEISEKPLIQIFVQIAKRKKQQKKKEKETNLGTVRTVEPMTEKQQEKNYRLVLTTQPKLEEIYVHFDELVSNLESQFQGLPRIEKLIFPNLVLSKEDTLGAFIHEMTLLTNEEISLATNADVEEGVKIDLNKNSTFLYKSQFKNENFEETLTMRDIQALQTVKTKIGRSLGSQSINLQVVRIQIGHIIEKVMQMADNQIMDFSKYTKYLNYDFYEDVLLQMKKEIHEKNLVKQLQEVNEYQETISEGSYKADRTYQDQTQDETNGHHSDGDAELDRVVVDPATYSAHYLKLQKAYWQIQRKVSSSYNFGLIMLDCTRFKETTTRKIGSLLQEFREHLVEEFDEILMHKWNENEKIRQEVNEDFGEDIEQNIAQMHLIEKLSCREVYQQLTDSIDVVKAYKFFLDSLKIAVTPEQFDKFLSLYSFPEELRIRVFEQYDNLKATQVMVSTKIQGKVLAANDQIEQFFLRFEEFYKVKVYTKKEMKARITTKCTNLTRASIEKAIEVAENESKILEEGSQSNFYVWEVAYVKQHCEQMDKLKREVAVVQAECDTIMRQQEALKMTPSSFLSLQKLKANVMPPIVQCWTVIETFNGKFFEWWSKSLLYLSVEEIEELTMDWQQKLNFVKKDATYMSNDEAASFVYYIGRQMEKLRGFMTIIVALKTKGLERRHFSKIEKELRDDLKVICQIHPAKMDLKYLASANIHSDEAIDIIKKHAAFAQKEFAIKVTLDQIEHDMNELTVQFVPYTGTETYVLNYVDHDLVCYRECEMKVTTIAQNLHSKHFEGKVQQMAKDVKYVIDFFKNWKQVIKFWAYLLPVFRQVDIYRIMPDMYDRFQLINFQYHKIMKEAKSYDPICYKGFARMNIFPAACDAMLKELDVLMYNVNRYLLQKRKNFPRLYFLSNDELMEMVANSNSESDLQSDLNKLFPGIYKLHILDPAKQPKSTRNTTQGSSKVTINHSVNISTEQHSTNESVLSEFEVFKRKMQGNVKFDNSNENSDAQDLQSILKKKKKTVSVQVQPSILGIRNEQNEGMMFGTPVQMEATLDVWCMNLEKTMQLSVNETIQLAVRDTEGDFMKWIEKYPTQMLLVSLDITFSRLLERLFKENVHEKPICSKSGDKKKKQPKQKVDKKKIEQRKIILAQSMTKELDRLFEKVIKTYNSLIKRIKEQMSDHQRVKIQNLIINRIHCRDQLRTFHGQGYEYAQDFLQQIQIKYIYDSSATMNDAWEKKYKLAQDAGDDVVNQDTNLAPTKPPPKAAPLASMDSQATLYAKVFHVTRVYGYEFLPNTQRLVITPLTERVYQSLYLAMFYDFGGCLYGPAGTGKTETVKDISKHIARNCFVFNCQNSMDINTMREMLGGVCACGYWSCFDEFNRLSSGLLSVLSEIFVRIQHTKQLAKVSEKKIEEIDLEGSIVPFKSECGIFITINPYSVGRSTVPSNLKNLFRTVTLITPDSVMIAQTILMNAGFERPKHLAQKIVRIFSLTQEQVAMQGHYDFGLRSLRAVLETAGKLKLKTLRIISDEQLGYDHANAKLVHHAANIKKVKVEKLGAKKKGEKKKELRKNLPAGSLIKRMEKQKVKNSRIEDSLVVDKKNPLDSLTAESLLMPDENRVQTMSMMESTVGQSTTKDVIEVMDQVSEIAESDVASDVSNIDIYDETTTEQQTTFVRSSHVYETKIDFEIITRLIEPDSEIQVTSEEELEEFIVFKSVQDVQIPRLALDDQHVFANICTDIFPRTPKPRTFQELKLKEMFPTSARLAAAAGQVNTSKHTSMSSKTIEDISVFKMKEIADMRLSESGLASSERFIIRLLQLYEAVQERSGIMIVGGPCTGKTTLFKVMCNVAKILNKMEYNKRQKQFLKQKAFRMGIPYTEESRGDTIKLETKDPFITKEFMPSAEEKQLISSTQIFFDVIPYVVNPKAMDHNDFFGVYNSENNEWTDGCITKLFKRARNNVSDKLKLLVVDGPIEPTWVENLNSVLDDNRKLCLGSGETLQMTSKMKMILEADDLRYCSPATISRCSVVYMEDAEDVLPLKSHINTWLKSLPSILFPDIDRLDMVINYFIFYIKDHFIHPDQQIHPVSKKQTIMTFTHIMESQILDYRQDKYLKKDEVLLGYWEAEQNGGRKYTWGDIVIDPQHKDQQVKDVDSSGSVSGEKSSHESETDKNSHSKSGTKHVSRKITDGVVSQPSQRYTMGVNSSVARQTTTNFLSLTAAFDEEALPRHKVKGYKKQRFPSQKWAESEQGFIDSIRFKTKWLHNFVLFSLIWSFGVNLKDGPKIEFEKWLKENATEEAFEKRAAQKQAEVGSEESIRIKSSSETSDSMTNSDESYQAQHILADAVEEGGFRIEPTPAFFAGSLKALTARLPNNQSIWNIFFDIDVADWCKWDVLSTSMSDSSQHMRLLDTTNKHVFLNNFWLTQDGIRYSYLIDRLISTKMNVLIMGPTGTGKTKLIRNYALKQLKANEFDKKFFNMTGECSASTLKSFVERKLIRMRKQQIMRPKGTSIHLFFVDDLNMCRADKWNIKSTHELMRQWFDHEGWYDLRYHEFTKVKNVQFCANVSLPDESLHSENHLQERFMWHWALVTFVNRNEEHLTEIYKHILGWIIGAWPEDVRGASTTVQITNATLEFYKYFKKNIPQSPNAFTQKINYRHMLSSLFGIIDLLAQFKSRMVEVAHIWIHEMCRTTLDRFVNENLKKKMFKKLKDTAFETFPDVLKKECDIDVDKPMFSYLKYGYTDNYTKIQPPLKGSINRELQTLEDTLDLYNQINFRHPMHLKLFGFILDNVCKGSRALKQPWPGSILLAQEGSGADKIAKLSLLATKYTSKDFASSLRNQFLQEKWSDDLRNAMNIIANDNKPLVLTFVERELMSDVVLQDLNSLMAHGELLSLLTEDEVDFIVTKLKLMSQKTQLGNNQMKQKPDSAFLEDFKEMCRQNLKVQITVTPTSDIFRRQMRKYTHLLNCSTVIFMGDWGQGGLELLAEGVFQEKIDKGIEENAQNEPALVLERKPNVIKCMVNIYLDVKGLVKQVFSQYGQTVYISPSHFEHFVKAYKKIYHDQESRYNELLKRFDKGLMCINQTEAKLEVVQDKLAEMSPRLVAQQYEIEMKLEESGKGKEAIGKEMDMLLLEEKILAYQLDEGTRVQENCHSEFGSTIPILNKAVTGLQQLNKRDIDELRALKQPPAAIRVLLQAVCIILKVDPIITAIQGKGNKFEKDYWKPSVGPKVLGAKNIAGKLSSIEPTSLNTEVMTELESLMDSEAFSFIAVDRSCIAAQGLFMWVRAVRNYYYVYKMNEGFREKMVISDLQREMHEKIIAENRSRIKLLNARLEEYKLEFAEKEKTIKEFQKNIEKCYIWKSRAARLIDALGSEKHKWTTCKILGQHRVKNLEGDCLIVAAIVIYLAPYDLKTREIFKAKWSKMIHQQKIYSSKRLVFNAHLIEPLVIQEWIERGLPNDSFSIQSAIIKHYCPIQTVILDPHQQAKKWLIAMHQPLVTLNQDAKSFVKHLKMALQVGQKLLIENVQDSISRNLYPIIRQAGSRKIFGKENEVYLDGRAVPIHLDFKMMITCVLEKPDFGPEISEHIILVNFTLDEASFDAQIMAIIIQEIEQELEVSMRIQRKDTRDFIHEVKECEKRILEMLTGYEQSEAMIENENLIEQLQGSAMMTERIGKGLKEIEKIEKIINKKKQEYGSLTRRATKLFFLVADFHKLSPMYQFTHQWFFSIFLDVLRKELDERKKDINIIPSKQDKKIMFEEIMESFTKQFFSIVCQQIFEKDKMLFSFLLAYKTLEAEMDIDFRQVEFFIKGPLTKYLQSNASKRVAQKPVPLINEAQPKNKKAIAERRAKKAPWITSTMWKLIDKLSKITPFDQPNHANKNENLAEHIENNNMIWQEYIYKDRKEEEERVFKKKREKDPGFQEDPEQWMQKDTKTDHTVVKEFSNGIPGGYEHFDYLAAHKRFLEQKRKEENMRRQLKENVARMMGGQGMKDEQEIQDEKKWDEWFAKYKDEDDEEIDDGNKFGEDSDDAFASAFLDGGGKVSQKNNVQDQMGIAEAIVVGIAQHYEFDVDREQVEVKVDLKTMRINPDLLRLCVIRCFRPDSLMTEIDNFISKFLGSHFKKVPSFNFDEVYKQTSQFRPTLIIQGDNIECKEELHRIRKGSVEASKAIYGNSRAGANMIHCVPCGSGNISRIARSVLTGALTGSWVLLDNVHLCMDLLPSLNQFISQINCVNNEFQSKVNAVIQRAQDLESQKERWKGDQQNGYMTTSIIDQRMLDKKRKEEEERNEMLEFAEGKANFAVEEVTLAIQPRSPVNMLPVVKQEEMKIKREAADRCLAMLHDISEFVDNPDSNDPESREKTQNEQALEKFILPEKWVFGVEQNFRLFVSSLPIDNFPTSFARKCTRMVLESPGSVYKNSQKNFALITPELIYRSITFGDELRKLFLSMTIMHSVVSRKEQFGPFGWSKPKYEFSPNDFEIGVKQLIDIFEGLTEQQRIPTNLIHHIFTHINYGSVVTNPQDLQNLHGLLKSFINSEMFELPEGSEIHNSYCLAGTGISDFFDSRVGSQDACETAFFLQNAWINSNYKIPGKTTDASQMVDFLKNNMPTDDGVDVFGLNLSACFKSSTEIAADLMSRVFKHQFIIELPHGQLQEAVALAQEANELNITTQAAKVEQEDLQKYQYFMKKMDSISELLSSAKEKFYQIDNFQHGNAYPSRASDQSLTIFAQKEIKLYQGLINRIEQSIKVTMDVLTGLRSEDDTIKGTFENLQSNRTPSIWLVKCYPSFSTLSCFVDNLKKRISYLFNLLEQMQKAKSNADIRVFKLPYFYDQKAFFTTLFQQVSRRTGVSIEKLNAEYRVMQPDEVEMDLETALSTNTFYLDGMWLNGARWIAKDNSLDECLFSYQSCQRLPMIMLTIAPFSQHPEVATMLTHTSNMASSNLAGLSPTKKQEQEWMQAPIHSPKVRQTSNLNPQMLQRVTNENLFVEKPRIPEWEKVELPLYVTSQRNWTASCSNEDSTMITLIPMSTKWLKPAFWIRQNIALLLYSDDEDQ